MLENDAVAVEKGGAVLWVAGLADMRERHPDVTVALAMVPDGQALIVLTHDPDMFPELRHRAQLTLAGHTHGGQIGCRSCAGSPLRAVTATRAARCARAARTCT